MISVIIASYKEPDTIGRAIETLAVQLNPRDEILIVASDKETLDAAARTQKKYRQVKIIKEKGKNGKPAALNLGVSKAKGDILLLTDGDTYSAPGAVAELLSHLNGKVGAVSGNPVSIDSRSTKYGFWAYMLTQVAHIRRKRAIKKGTPFFCSGYLFIIRKSLFPRLSEELLSEDGFISNYVYTKGYSIGYAEKARVFVKYPSNFADWIKQKKRSAGGYNQIKKMTGAEMRSFRIEARGFADLFKFVTRPRELFWLLQLFVARVYLWALIYRDINVAKKSRAEIWTPIKSTK